MENLFTLMSLVIYTCFALSAFAETKSKDRLLKWHEKTTLDFVFE